MCFMYRWKYYAWCTYQRSKKIVIQGHQKLLIIWRGFEGQVKLKNIKGSEIIDLIHNTSCFSFIFCTVSSINVLNHVLCFFTVSTLPELTKINSSHCCQLMLGTSTWLSTSWKHLCWNLVCHWSKRIYCLNFD